MRAVPQLFGCGLRVAWGARAPRAVKAGVLELGNRSDILRICCVLAHSCRTDNDTHQREGFS